MKEGLFVLVALTATMMHQQQLSAQETTTFAAGKNMVGIRISSADAVVNHSITYKRFLTPSLAAEGLFSISDPAALGFLLEKYTPITSAGLSWFWGAGAYAGFGGVRRFGAQGVIGLDLIFPSLPINLSVDWKPELNFSKQFSFEPSALGVSARFVF